VLNLAKVVLTGKEYQELRRKIDPPPAARSAHVPRRAAAGKSQHGR
jgi:hypothetical protein